MRLVVRRFMKRTPDSLHIIEHFCEGLCMYYNVEIEGSCLILGATYRHNLVFDLTEHTCISIICSKQTGILSDYTNNNYKD